MALHPVVYAFEKFYLQYLLEVLMIKVAVVGAGYWGKNLVRTFDSLEATTLSYIVDKSPEILSSHSSYDAERTDDYDLVLSDESVDAVAIATPPVSHHQVAMAALKAGKHVFVEKPLTLDVAEAEELVAFAREQDRMLMVGHLLLYHPCVNALKEIIASGQLGDVLYLYSQRLNLGKVRTDENALLSLAPHDISVALYLIDKTPVSVTASGQSYLQDGIEDVVFMNITFEGGQMANVHVSWLDPHKVRRLTVVGSGMMASFDDMEAQEKVRIYDKGVNVNKDYDSYAEYLSLRNGSVHSPEIEMHEPLKCECAHFADSIINKKTPLSDGNNGLMVTRILDAAMQSLKEGNRPVSL